MVIWYKTIQLFQFKKYYEGNLINSNGTFVPDNYEFPVFDDDLNVFLLNPNSIASFKILNSIILSIIRSIVKHICGTSNDCLYMTSIPKNTMLIILNKIDANYPILPKKYNELNCDAKKWNLYFINLYGTLIKISNGLMTKKRKTNEKESFIN
ncbi:hypothetical protein DERF_001749 [Dermatophagoides farinae]|uniref:Uncharacterized protein n=1 Tax=Dermatophagoides farinae TaxID=6954 RepID=A0A922I4B0_DERFA|nr:hypothetical protein DERF_005567 [Dermatophagoides farinae]KAH9527744.1 hypothetical protein DERF_001749 [Dermatophagoides farinae]